MPQQELHKQLIGAAVRIPETIHPGKAGRCKRLVDRSIRLYPRVSLGHLPGVAGQFLFKRRGVEGSIAGTTAVMNQAHHGLDVQCTQPVQPLIGPAPIQFVGVIGGGAFPQHRIAERSDAQFSDAVEVIGPVVVTTPAYLILVNIAHPVNGTFNTAPEC